MLPERTTLVPHLPIPAQAEPDFIPWLNQELNRRGWKVAELARRIVNLSQIDPDSAEYVKRVNGKGAVLSRMLNQEVGLGNDLAREIADALEISQVEVFRHAGLITERVHDDQQAAYEYLRLLGEIKDDSKRKETIDLVETILRRVVEQRESNSTDPTAGTASTDEPRGPAPRRRSDARGAK
jgi:hypothetical protein